MGCMMKPSDLRLLSEAMGKLHASDEATIGYECMSGALIWSDETPDEEGFKLAIVDPQSGAKRDIDPKDMWCMRPVLRYRTSLIFGKPDERFEDFWREAQKAFPDWPGFQENRCKEDSGLQAKYLQLSGKKSF